jgi:translation initiation factor IF-2
MECGIGVDEFSKFKEGDKIVVYEIEHIKRTLETA